MMRRGKPRLALVFGWLAHGGGVGLGVGVLVTVASASAFLHVLVGVCALQGARLRFEVVDLLCEYLQLVVLLLRALCSLDRWMGVVVAA